MRSSLLAGLTLNELTSLEQLEAIEHDWRGLWERDQTATPFQSPDWLVPWTRRLWGGGKLRVLAIRADRSLVAVAPLFLWGFGSHPERIRLSFLGSGISDYLGMTCDPEFAPEAARLVIDWITHSCEEWDICNLEELREGAPLLNTGPPAPLWWRRLPCSVCPVVPLPRSMADHLAALDAKFRRNLKVAEKRLTTAGPVEFVQSNEGNLAGLLHCLFRLHNDRWRKRSGISMLSTDAVQAFHTEVAERFCARGILRLFGLLLDRECIAAQYNFLAKGKAYFYLSGFDEKWQRGSPGSVLLAHAIASAIQEGAREVDFLRNPEPYKYEWGAKDRPTRRLLISRAA